LLLGLGDALRLFGVLESRAPDDPLWAIR